MSLNDSDLRGEQYLIDIDFRDETPRKELSEAGERDAVLQFLARCARFWVPQLRQIPEWRQAIERGEMPNFGHNARM